MNDLDNIAKFVSLKYCRKAKAFSGHIPHTTIMSAGPNKVTAIKAIISAASLVIQHYEKVAQENQTVEFNPHPTRAE